MTHPWTINALPLRPLFSAAMRLYKPTREWYNIFLAKPFNVRLLFYLYFSRKNTVFLKWPNPTVSYMNLDPELNLLFYLAYNEFGCESNKRRPISGPYLNLITPCRTHFDFSTLCMWIFDVFSFKRGYMLFLFY